MQQVNLLSDDLKPAREVLSPRQSLALLGVAAAVLLVISTVQGIRIYLLDAEKTALEVKFTALQAATIRLNSPEQQAAQRALETAVEALTLRYEMRQTSLAALEGGAVFPRGGFAGYFEDLASRPIEGLWLTAINLARGGEVVQLAGSTVDPARVPAFLHALSEDTHFDGKRFEQLRLVAGESGGLDFVVGPAGDS